MSPPKECIVTGDRITPENDSRAHVIPSALGGRLKPKGIVSRKGNGILDDKFDDPLIKAFQPIMNLIGGSADRSKTPIETRMTGPDGKVYVFTFGQELQHLNPEFVEEEVGGEYHFRMIARTPKEAKTLLGRVKAKHPQFDVEEALRLATEEHRWPDGPMHVPLQVGPRILFPWTFVTAAVFAAHHGQQLPPGFRAYVDTFDLEAPMLPTDTFYFMPDRSWIDALGEVTHRIALVGDPAKGRMLFYAELFDIFGVGVTWPYAGDEPFCATYAVDVIAGRETSATVDLTAIRAMTWAATHKLGDQALYTLATERIGAVVGIAMDRQRRQQIDEVMRRALGDPDGRQLTVEDYVRLLEEYVVFAERDWTNPAVGPEVRAAVTATVHDMFRHLTGKVPAGARPGLNLLLQPLLDRLAKADAAAVAREAASV